MTAFIELQAGVTVDENGEEITIRAGDPEDVAYYLDGIPLPTTDHFQTRVYRNFNRLSIQELTIVTGGMNAEYGNAQGGVVSAITREGANLYHGLIDYQLIPPGKKHWGTNVYDSPIHRGNNKWNDPTWVAETVTLSNGSEVPAHQRLDYTGISGHSIEGQITMPLTQHLSLFASSRWQRRAAAFPSPQLHTPYNINSFAKLTYAPTPSMKVRFGGLVDRRDGSHTNLDPGGGLNIGDQAKNLFMVDRNPEGGFEDLDRLLYITMTHLLSSKTFYEIHIANSVSRRDTSDVRLPLGISHISEAVSGDAVKDRAYIGPHKKDH